MIYCKVTEVIDGARKQEKRPIHLSCYEIMILAPIPADEIRKTEITLRDSSTLYTTETVEEILARITQAKTDEEKRYGDEWDKRLRKEGEQDFLEVLENQKPKRHPKRKRTTDIFGNPIKPPAKKPTITAKRIK